MFEIKLKDTTRDVKIQSDAQIDMMSEGVEAFIRALDALHAAARLASFSGNRHEPEPLVYDYHFVTVDGRQWHQEIDFRNGVKMTFAVNDKWALAEFVPHRTVRDEFVTLVVQYGIKSIEVKYV